MKYRTEVDISGCTVGNTQTLLDMGREQGEAVLSEDGLNIILTFDVGTKDGGPEDLWDLRSVIEELEANLSGYLDSWHIAKPVPVP